MLLGLPLDTWVLIVAATLPGLLLVACAFVVHREGDRAAKRESQAGTADG